MTELSTASGRNIKSEWLAACHEAIRANMEFSEIATKKSFVQWFTLVK